MGGDGQQMSDELKAKIINDASAYARSLAESHGRNPDGAGRAVREGASITAQEALELNEPLAIAYYMKEELRQLWDQPDKATAKAFLLNWAARAKASGINVLMRFANTLTSHQTGILNYYDYPISTGPLEGTNNKIKTLHKQAYGFRDMEFFKLKIMAIHEAKYALVG
jgi:transposase